MNIIDWSTIGTQLESNTLYHFPKAKGIDMIILQESQLILIQVASGSTHLREKFVSFRDTLNRIKSHYRDPMFGWFISLFPIKSQEQDITILAAAELQALLGKEIYDKLCETKRSIE